MKDRKQYLLLILPLLLIFGLTLQNSQGTVALTQSAQAFLGRLLEMLGSDAAWVQDFKLMRRLAHTVEYFLLGLGAYLCIKNWWKAGLFCAAVSLLDELLKEALPGREFDFIDMRFDFAGYAFGILLIIGILQIAEFGKNRG